MVVEDLTWSYFGLKFGVCLDGQNACPPDDVGGPWGYSEFLASLADPGHEEQESYLDRAAGHFDPAAFDLAEANALLQKVR